MSGVFAASLEETLAQTLSRNPALAAAGSTYEARYKEQFVTLSDMLPQVRAFATETHNDTNTKSNAGVYNSAFSSDYNTRTAMACS